jgi:predicted nucleic acid-binding protein
LKPQDALIGVTRLGLDANILITILNVEPLLLPFCMPFLQAIIQQEIEAVVSHVVFTECLVRPYQTKNLQAEASALQLLERTPGLITTPVSDVIAKRAARLRANYNLRTPDALHIATAIETGCETFLTNDRQFSRVTEIRVIILEDIDLT